jgi:hypothetical protein
MSSAVINQRWNDERLFGRLNYFYSQLRIHFCYSTPQCLRRRREISSFSSFYEYEWPKLNPSSIPRREEPCIYQIVPKTTYERNHICGLTVYSRRKVEKSAHHTPVESTSTLRSRTSGRMLVRNRRLKSFLHLNIPHLPSEIEDDTVDHRLSDDETTHPGRIRTRENKRTSK